MHILVKYASRSRPARFFEGLHNIIDMAADKGNITIAPALDVDDYTMFSAGDFLPEIKAELEKVRSKIHYPHLQISIGRSKSKIDAINRETIVDDWDILVNFSDDMRFTVYGWDELIREGFRCNGPDKFLHFPDSTARNMLCTMTIIDRKYYDRDGYIYHPSYKSLWCDNEAQEAAKLRGCYVYMGTQIFDHYHPAYGLADWDEQYRRQQALWAEDELNYIYRKSKNFLLDQYGNQLSEAAFNSNTNDA